MPWQFRDHDLQRRSHVCLYEVTAVRCRVGLSDDNVRMDLLPVTVERHVAEQRQDFDLLVDWDISIVLRRPVKKCDNDARKSTDGAELAGLEPLFQREAPERRHHLIAC